MSYSFTSQPSNIT